jgi:hypothetical protein
LSVKSEFWLFVFVLLLLSFSVPAQVQQSDSLSVVNDTLPVLPVTDPSYIRLKENPSDTVSDNQPIKRKNFLEEIVDYHANDSMPYDVKNQMLYLYGDAFIKYADIELKADLISVDLNTRTLFATFQLDSVGKKIGKPQFKQGEQEFSADTIYYNFDTKRGFIKTLKTEQQGGFLHSETTKRMEDERICIQDGKFTTCNDDHPHFYISLKKAIFIPDDKIISGPLNLVISDIPTPAYLPFGFFPSQKKFSSGILMPEYGEENNRGFYLRNGGYYLALNDYFDLAIRGDIYSMGTWGLQMATNYKWLYHFSGNFHIKYFRNVFGEKLFSNYSTSNDFSVKWSHKQDAKSSPGQNFSANVNFSTSTFDKNNTYSVDNRLQNTKNSSISYSKTWGGAVQFSADLRHSQNSQTQLVNMTFPSLTLNVNRQYPFRAKNTSGSFKWYENIQVEYKSKFVSDLSVLEENFFTTNILDSLQSGFQHDIPVSANFKFWNHFNFTPSLGYTGKLYPSYKVQRWDPAYQINDTTFGKVVEDVYREITYAHTFSPVANLGFNPTLYGMYSFTKGRIKAIRHVMTPGLSFSWKPPLGKENDFIFRPVVLGADSVSNLRTYSIYDGSKYGAPSKKATSGSVSFSLGNNFEMKRLAKTDTGDVEKKTKLLETLNFRTRYDFYKDEKNLDPVSVTGSTSLFKDVKINFGGTLNPYALDEAGLETANWNIIENGALFRLTQANFTLSYSIRGKQKSKKEGEAENPGFPTTGSDTLQQSLQDEGIIGNAEEHYVDFNLPWSLRMDYSWHYSKPTTVAVTTRSLRFGGEINLTEKWKVSLNSGYDFNRREFTYTTIDIYRDLHCWEARFSWVPFGTYMSYNFQINVKPGMLQDLKYNKTKSWYDNF